MTDTIDLNQRRAAKETAKNAERIVAETEGALNNFTDAVGSMMNPKFIAFVQFAEANLPQHSVIKEHWFQAMSSSLTGVFIKEMPPEVIKRYFELLIDWMIESYVDQIGSLPTYPPVVCEGCANHAPPLTPPPPAG